MGNILRMTLEGVNYKKISYNHMSDLILLSSYKEFDKRI